MNKKSARQTNRKQSKVALFSANTLLMMSVLTASTGFALTYSAQALATCATTDVTTSLTTSITDAGGPCAITVTGSVALTAQYSSAITLNIAGSSISNSGTISGGPVGNSIYISTASSTEVLITNAASGVIAGSIGDGIFFRNGSTASIYNYGSIGNNGSSSSGITLTSATNSNTVTNLVNTGSIRGGYVGVRIDGTNSMMGEVGGTINALTNAGLITGNPLFGDILNSGTLTTLNNKQGAATSALIYGRTLPTHYNVIVLSSADYGKISFLQPSGTMTFGIYSGGVSGVAASILAAGTYSSVLTGISASNLTGSTAGTYGSYNWSLVNSNGQIWDLIVTAGSSASNSSASNSSIATVSITNSVLPPSNIVTGGSFNLANIGVTANPVFAGGVLLLTAGNASSQAFTVTSSGGTIQSPSGGSAVLSGVMSGSGGLTFAGSGTTVLSGTNSYAGGTTVASGTLSVEGTAPTGYGDVNVQTGGTLMGTGTINGNILVAGILKPGNSPGYLASTGNVTMTSGSTYQQDIAGTTQANSATPVGATGYYSYLNVVGGQFIISSGATLAPRVANLFTSTESGYGSTPYTPVLGDRFRIVSADGGISGKFSSLTQPAELAAGTQFLPFYNMAGSNSLDLAVIPTSYKTTIAAASGNKNAQSVGAALDRMVVAAQSGSSTAAQDQLLYAGSAKTAAALSGYTQGLAGEVYPAAVAVIAQTTQRVQQAVLSRLGDTMGLGLPNSMTSPAGNTGLMSTTNTVLAGGVASSAVSTNPGVNPNADAKSFSNGNVWGDLAYQYGNRNSDSNAGGWNSNLYQLVFGSDFFTSNGMKIGGGLALSSTTLNPTYGSGTIQQGSLFAYGKMPIQEFVVDAMASFGLNNSDLSRGDGTGLSNGFRNKSVSGNDAMVSLGLSRPFDTDSIRITPFARVTWQIVTQSGVNEGGVASALNVNSFTGNGVRGMLGIAAGSKTNNPMTEQYTYRAYVGVGADSSGVLNPSMTASLAGISTNINTPNAGATFVQAGLYATAKFADNAYAFAGLSGEARSGQTLGAVNVGLRVQF